MRKKNHFIEMAEKRLEGQVGGATLKEVEEMIGFYTPIKEKGKIVWDVTMADEGSGYLAKTQFEAETIASLEQIKHMLYILLKNTDTVILNMKV